MKFIAKKDTWFDEGTEAKLLTDCGGGFFNGNGIFEGIRNGKVDEELCGYEEFKIVKENPDEKLPEYFTEDC